MDALHANLHHTLNGCEQYVASVMKSLETASSSMLPRISEIDFEFEFCFKNIIVSPHHIKGSLQHLCKYLVVIQGLFCFCFFKEWIKLPCPGMIILFPSKPKYKLKALYKAVPLIFFSQLLVQNVPKQKMSRTLDLLYLPRLVPPPFPSTRWNLVAEDKERKAQLELEKLPQIKVEPGTIPCKKRPFEAALLCGIELHLLLMLLKSDLNLWPSLTENFEPRDGDHF